MLLSCSLLDCYQKKNSLNLKTEGSLFTIFQYLGAIATKRYSLLNKRSKVGQQQHD